MNTYERLVQAIHGADPYEGFAPIIDQLDLRGWNGNHRALVKAVEDEQPAIIIDLGVWKGQSTITLAKTQRAVCPQGCLIAIDTFLGSPEHWNKDRPEMHSSLMFRHGRPSYYEVFLSNVVLAGLTDRILPFPQTSENAAVILRRHGISPNLIHIDAAHEYGSVLRDIEVYWDLLAPGGLLMGDDLPFPGVSKAVNHFADRNDLMYCADGPKWWIRKPG